METIRQQIKKQPKLHFNLFACWALAIISGLAAFVTENLIFAECACSFLAVGFVIAAIIDKEFANLKKGK